MLPKVHLAATVTEELEIVHGLSPTSPMANILRQYRGKEVTVIVQDKEAPRSLRQNSMYWGLLVVQVQAFIKETQGELWTPHEVHCYHLMHVCRDRPVIKEITFRENGEDKTVQTVVFTTKTTSQMSMKEFNEFVDDLTQHWAEKELVLQLPQEI
jgi:hypothetical protein